MTDPTKGPQVGSSFEEEEPTGPVIRDKRRLDPETGAVRESGTTAQQSATADASTDDAAVGADEAAGAAVTGSDVHPDTALAADRLADLQRLQAEYVNYKKRVDRDREVQRDAAVARVLEALLPVLDDIHLSRQHADLEGTPFEKIADKLESTLNKQGLETFGEVGEAFDPAHHEALMHIEAEVPEGATATTIVQVMQPGYRIGDRVIRPARVAVADPS
ncbi:nucleotide exchange factor GrpE [Rudaeicoccus suwonensis]|uniref:Protein GrpE n=1 Tax=Rudaeicoccus suwonensis TaxID=657409 RepID=A0A561E774_9MICO|nr:nucleotide exchange factor GrpE [Rudaeicoccus suwonensis]TWE11459.1 molecular chaperone GrpE [Rudaeicoccus suwonensis]